MRHILHKAALGIAAALLVVAAGGGGSPGAGAAPCAGDGPGSTTYDGRTAAGGTYQFDFCSDPSLMLSVDLQWNNGKKDLALRVTEPDGTMHVADARGSSEHLLQRAPLEEGTWTVEVVNKSNGSVSYALTISFVVDPAP